MGYYDAIKNELQKNKTIDENISQEGPHIDRSFLRKGEIVLEDFSPEFQDQLIFHGIITPHNLSPELDRNIAWRGTIEYEDFSLEAQRILAKNKYIKFEDLSDTLQDRFLRKNIAFQDLDPELRMMFDYMTDRTITMIDCGTFTEEFNGTDYDGGEW